MNTSLLLAVTFFASIDTTSATPAPKTLDAIFVRCEATTPDAATIAVKDGQRFIVFQSTSMVAEIRAKRGKSLAAADVVAGLAACVTAKKSVEKAV